MAQNNLMISDAEYIYAEKIFTTYVTTLQEIGTEYTSLMRLVMSDAFGAPETSAKLTGLCEQMNKLTGMITSVAEGIDGKSKAFIQTVDKLDQFIY